MNSSRESLEETHKYELNVRQLLIQYLDKWP